MDEDDPGGGVQHIPLQNNLDSTAPYPKSLDRHYMKSAIPFSRPLPPPFFPALLFLTPLTFPHSTFNLKAFYTLPDSPFSPPTQKKRTQYRNRFPSPILRMFLKSAM